MLELVTSEPPQNIIKIQKQFLMIRNSYQIGDSHIPRENLSGQRPSLSTVTPHSLGAQQLLSYGSLTIRNNAGLFQKDQINNSRSGLTRGDHNSNCSQLLVLRSCSGVMTVILKVPQLSPQIVSSKPLGFISRTPVCLRYCFYTYLQ